MRSIFPVLLFPLHLFAQATIHEEVRWIKTYPFSDPDPAPILLKQPSIYPYFVFDEFSQEGEEKPWTVVTLENPYIRVQVLPQIGGKIAGAVEKSTGHEFLYLNEVVKFRHIAMRGPWTSGGAEFNFGLVGHAPTVATPVNYWTEKTKDGVRCVLGTLDLTSRTRWSVEVFVPRDKAQVRIRTLWVNPSPFHQSYYCWVNNAVEARPDLQYFYPGFVHRPHGHSIPMQPWPVDGSGRDLSWYRNHDFGADHSHFVMGEYADFYGGYYHELGFGFGHWSLYDDMPGKKMWIWALSRQGAIWEDLLTDADGQYSEPQSGRLLSQDDHEFFGPYSADAWNEILFPVRGTGGLSQASQSAVLHVVRREDSLEVSICGLQRLDEDLIVRSGTAERFKQRIRLTPMSTYRKTLAWKDSANIQVTLGDKLFYDEDGESRRISRPFPYLPPDESTAQGLYHAGLFFEKRREWDLAMSKYRSCLEKDCQHDQALVRLAELHVRRGEYLEGLKAAERALGFQMYDPAANYVYGIAARALGNEVDALETLGWAARSIEYRSNAYTQMAEICMLKDAPRALVYAQRAEQANGLNIRAHEVLAVAYRLLGRKGEANQVLSSIRELEPLNHLVRFEEWLAERTRTKKEAFTGMIRDELPHEHFLELALSYQRMGLEEDALAVLDLAPEHPVVLFWKAYLLRDRKSEESMAFLKKADSLSPHLVFPFREESAPVFEWAASFGGWKPLYYLGLIRWFQGRTEEARDLLIRCGEPDFAPFYRTRAGLEPGIRDSLLSKALNSDPADWRNWHTLIQSRLAGREPRALALAIEAAARFPKNRILGMDHARALFGNGLYRECYERLDSMTVLPQEGGWEAHDLYMRSQIHLALEAIREKKWSDAVRFLQGSKRYPENLGTGEPFDADFRLQDMLIWACGLRQGEKEAAEEALRRAADYTRTHGIGGMYPYFGLVALEQSGLESEAEKWVRSHGVRGKDPLKDWQIGRYEDPGIFPDLPAEAALRWKHLSGSAEILSELIQPNIQGVGHDEKESSY